MLVALLAWSYAKHGNHQPGHCSLAHWGQPGMPWGCPGDQCPPACTTPVPACRSWWLGEEAPFLFCCLHSGVSQLPSILTSLRCQLPGLLLALCASLWMSLSVPLSLGLLGACPPLSNPPTLANHLPTQLVINSSSGCLGKRVQASTCCSQLPCQQDALQAIATIAWATATMAEGP